MNNSAMKLNRRILIVDDNQSIHADFRKILGAPDAGDEALDAAEARLFGAQQGTWFVSNRRTHLGARRAG